MNAQTSNTTAPAKGATTQSGYLARVTALAIVAIGFVPEAAAAITAALFKGDLDAHALHAYARADKLAACWAYVQRLITEEGMTAFDAVTTVRETVEMDLHKNAPSAVRGSMQNAIHFAHIQGIRAFLAETENLTTRPRPS